MNTDGQIFLERLNSGESGFDRRFAQICARLDLGATLNGKELDLLHRVAFLATLTNISINGLGGCGGRIKPEQEFNRSRLERCFMAERDILCGSLGWQRLPSGVRDVVQNVFFNVFVSATNLAW